MVLRWILWRETIVVHVDAEELPLAVGVDHELDGGDLLLRWLDVVAVYQSLGRRLD